MKRHFEKLADAASRVVKHWWLTLISGILCVIAGILVFVFPLESYLTLSVIFGVMILFAGVAELVVASSSRNYFAMRSYAVVGGVLDLLIGIFLCIYPGISLVALPVMLGVWMLYHSIIIICFGSDLDTFKIPGSALTVIGGILLALLSLLVLMNPMGTGVATVIILTGFGLIILGVMICGIAIRLKDIQLHFEAERGK